MKRNLIISLVLALLLCGCNSGDSDAAVTESSAVTDGVVKGTETVVTNDKEPSAPAEKGALPVRGIVYDSHGDMLYYMDYEYDADGNAVKVTAVEEDGKEVSRTEREYDENGNELVAITYSGDTVIKREETKYDGARKEEKVSYDSDGNVDHTVKYECDGAGNVIKETEYSPAGEVDYLFELEYDENGKEIVKKQIGKDGSVIIKNVTEYNADGNIVKLTQYYGDGSLFGYFDYEYDENGNMVKMIEYGSDGKVDLTIVYEY